MLLCIKIWMPLMAGRRPPCRVFLSYSAESLALGCSCCSEEKNGAATATLTASYCSATDHLHQIAAHPLQIGLQIGHLPFFVVIFCASTLHKMVP